MSLLEFNEQSSYGKAFLVAVLNTLVVSVIGVLLATVMGFVIGIARLSTNFLVSRLATIYIEIIRNIPLLLQIFFWYFAVLRTLPGPKDSLTPFYGVYLNIRGLYLPKPIFEADFGAVGLVLGVTISLAIILIALSRKKFRDTGRGFKNLWLINLSLILGVTGSAFFMSGSPISLDMPFLSGFNFQGGLTIIPELVALLFALSIYTAAFIAEIVRAGILAVSKGQSEAAQALGLTRSQTLRLVVVPQALRVIIPPLTSQYLNLTKNSSLAAAIAYPDLVLVFAGTVLMQTGQAVEVILMTMGVYLLISLIISGAMNWFNKRVAI
jgi:general L-amino acid transport system permease protein